MTKFGLYNILKDEVKRLEGPPTRSLAPTPTLPVIRGESKKIHFAEMKHTDTRCTRSVENRDCGGGVAGAVVAVGQIRRPLVDDSRHARAQPTIISISSPRKATVRIEFEEEGWMMMEREILSFKE